MGLINRRFLACYCCCFALHLTATLRPAPLHFIGRFWLAMGSLPHCLVARLIGLLNLAGLATAYWHCNWDWHPGPKPGNGGPEVEFGQIDCFRGSLLYPFDPFYLIPANPATAKECTNSTAVGGSASRQQVDSWAWFLLPIFGYVLSGWPLEHYQIYITTYRKKPAPNCEFPPGNNWAVGWVKPESSRNENLAEFWLVLEPIAFLKAAAKGM